jgi:hypothetical protein
MFYEMMHDKKTGSFNFLLFIKFNIMSELGKLN